MNKWYTLLLIYYRRSWRPTGLRALATWGIATDNGHDGDRVSKPSLVWGTGFRYYVTRHM